VPLADAERAMEARRPVDAREAFELWEENSEAFEIFIALATQWHRVSVGLGGVTRTGLMYQSATDEMRERGIPRARRLEIRGDLRAMEYAAIETWGESARE
jgi:hypothetical protein